MSTRRVWRIVGMVLLCLSVLACGERRVEVDATPQYSRQGKVDAPVYVLAIHPLHNPARLFEVYGPLVDHLNRQIPAHTFALEASRNYEEFERKLSLRQVAFALPNPYQTLKAMEHGYHVIAKMGDDAQFRGLLLVRRDAGITQVSDLRGRKVAYPAATALAATLLPQAFLHSQGLDVNRDIENLYVGSQESSILNVYLGRVAAAATWTQPWQAFQKTHPAQASELVVQWETAPLINNSVVARDDVPAATADQVAQELANLHTTPAGRALLAAMELTRFERADDARYEVVRDFIDTFQRTVRPLSPESAP
jgi:phosphonate transport system substrate-binding protein